MELKKIHGDFSVCQVEDYSLVHLDSAYCFIEKTEQEIPWYVLPEKYPPMYFRKKRDGKQSAFRAFWTIL